MRWAGKGTSTGRKTAEGQGCEVGGEQKAREGYVEKWLSQKGEFAGPRDFDGDGGH